MGNTYIKNAYAEQTFKRNDRRSREQKDKLDVAALDQVDIMTTEQKIDELYRNVVQNVKNRDFFFPDAFFNCTNLFYTGSETTEEKIIQKEEVKLQNQKLLSGRLYGEAVLNDITKQYEETQETVPLTPESVTQFTFNQHKRFAIMYSLFASRNKDLLNKKNDFLEYLKTFLSKEQKKRKKGKEVPDRMKLALDQGFQFLITLFKDVTEAATMDASGKTLGLLLKALENLHFTLKETETGALHGTDQQSFIIDANLDQARAYLASILSHPKTPHNLATIALRIIFQIGRVRSNIEDMLVVCDILDKHPDIDLREDLHHLKVQGEFKEEEPPKEEEKVTFVDPPYTDDEKFVRLTVHSQKIINIQKDQFPVSLIDEKTQSAFDGTFIYLQSPTLGLMKLKVLQDSLETVIHKPAQYTVESRLAFLNGKLYLRNLHEPTFLSDQEETGAIQLNCDTLEEISLDSGPDEDIHEDDDSRSHDNDDDDDNDDNADDEDNSDEEVDHDEDDDDEGSNDNDDDEDEGDGSGNSEEDDDYDTNIMFLECDTPVTDKMFQETPLISDGKYLYAISMKFSEEEIIKAIEQGKIREDLIIHIDDPQLAQVMLEPVLSLEKIDPSKKGELQVQKSITLLLEDGISNFKLGCYKDTREILGVMKAFINGETLILEYKYNGKLNVANFEANNGKLITKKSTEIPENQPKLSFDPKLGVFSTIALLKEDNDSGEKIKIEKFTLAGFGKNPNALTGGAQIKDEAFISKIQNQIYTDSDPKEEAKIENPSLYLNLFDRFMYQTQPEEKVRSTEAQQFSTKANEHTAEIIKTMILFSALKEAEALKKLIAKKMPKKINQKQMKIFKYKNLTLLRGQNFELLMTQIQRYTPLLNEAKTKDNLPQQYNLLYLLQIMSLNLQCLDICNNDLQTLFNKNETKVQLFVDTLNQIIFPLSEESFNKDNFETEQSVKLLWSSRLKACAETFMLKSIQYIYSDKAQILNEIHAQVSLKHEEAKDDSSKSKGKALVTHLLDSVDNMSRFVKGFNSHNCDVTLLIICESLNQIKDACLEQIEKGTNKVDSKVQQLQKFLFNLVEQIIINYTNTLDMTETKLAMGNLFIKVTEQVALSLKEILEKINFQVNLHLDNQPPDLNVADVKTFFQEKTDSLLKYLTKDTFFVKLLLNLLFSLTMFSQTEDDNIYHHSPSSLPIVRQSILLLLEPSEYFNTHILEKRKDKIPKYQPEEIKDPNYTIEEFCDLKLTQQAKVIMRQNHQEQFIGERDRSIDIEELGFEIDPWSKQDNPDNFDKTCHGKRLFGYCPNHDKAGCNIAPEEGFMHWSFKYFFCSYCTAVYKTIRKIKNKEVTLELQKLPAEAPTFQLKKFNDLFSRQLCWFLGQLGAQLIIINPEKPVEEGKEEDKQLQKEKEIESMVLNSKLLSGGIDSRFIQEVFTKKSLEIISAISLEKKENVSSIQTDEQFKLLLSVIEPGQNENVDKLISNLQIYLERKRPIFPSARVGGELGLCISRAAFGAIVKFNDLTEALSSLVDEIDLQSMEINTDQDNVLQAIKAHIDFEPISKRWEQASRIRIWFQEQKKVILDRITAEIKKQNSDIQAEDLEKIAYCKFEDEYQQLLNKVVQKATFLLKLNIPGQIFTKNEEDLEPTSLLSKCSCGKDHSQGDHEAHPDLKDRLHHIKTILTKQASTKPPETQKKELFESATSSVLVYLQVPIELTKVQEQIEKFYIKGLQRAYGLNIIAKMLQVEALPVAHKQDLMNWFASSLRTKKYQLSYYLDGLRGCGAYIESQIRNQFFAIIRIILSLLKSSNDEIDIKNLLSVLEWKFNAKDHQALKQSDLLRILYNLGDSSMIYNSWGSKTTLSHSVIQMFEHIMHSVMGRLIKQDDRLQGKEATSKSELKLEKKLSQVDSNATEGLLNQGFEIIFKEMARYLSGLSNPGATIDYNTFLKVKISKQTLPFDFNSTKKSKVCGPERGRNTKWCKLSEVKDFKEMPWIKQIKVWIVDNYVDGIHCIYEQSEGKNYEWIVQQQKCTSARGNWINFDFQPNEYITQLFYRTGGWMDNMEIKTNKGREFQFGGQGGTKYTCFMPVQPGKIARVVSFGGQHYQHMESMFAHYVEVDPNDEQADSNQDYVDFIKAKVPVTKDLKSDWLLFMSDKEIGAAKAFIGASSIVDFVHKCEVYERKEKMIKAYEEAIKQRYSEAFINRLLNVIEQYSSVASINVLKFLEPLQRSAVIKNILAIFILSEPSLKLKALNILKNLIEANTPHYQFELAIQELKKDLVMKNFQVEFEGSEFLRFLYDYLVDTRRMIWNSNRNEGPGTFVVTSDIVRILTTMIAISPQEEFKSALINKIRSFLQKNYESWKIEEADVIFSIMETSGQFMSLTAGSHVKISDTDQHGIILGFSSNLKDCKDLKSANANIIKTLRPTAYLQDSTQRALMMYKGPSHDIIVVDVHKLVPEYCDSYFVEQQILDKDIFISLLDILTKTGASVELTHLQLQILKVIQRAYYKDDLREVIIDRFNELIQVLERFSNQDQTNKEISSKLPVELLEARASQIRAHALESPNCIVGQNIITAKLSRKCGSFTFYARQEGKASKIVIAGISESFNEGTLWKAQFSIEHSVTLFQDVQNNPSLLIEQGFDILVIDPIELSTQSDHSVLLQALSNSNILLFTDNLEDTYTILASLRDLSSPSTSNFDHKPIFVIDHESYLDLISPPTPQILSSKTYPTTKEESKELPPLIVQQTPRDKEYEKDPGFVKVFPEKAVNCYGQQIQTIIEKGMGLRNLQDVIESKSIQKDKRDGIENKQVEAVYAKIFEPTFDDKQEYHLLMKQILKQRARETMLDITWFQVRSPVEHPLSPSYFFQAYNDAKNKERVLGDKKQARRIIEQLTLQFTRDKEYGVRFVEERLLAPTIDLFTQLFKNNSFLNQSYFKQESFAKKFPLPSMIYDITKQMLVNDKLFEILSYSKTIISDLLTFLVGYGLYIIQKISDDQFNQCLKYFALASKLLTTVRNSKNIPEETLKTLCENKFLNNLFQKRPSKNDRPDKYEIAKLIIEIGIEFIKIKSEAMHQNGIKWYMRQILKHEYLRSQDIITYFRIYYGKTRRQTMFEKSVDKTKFEDNKEALEKLKNIMSCSDKETLVALLKSTKDDIDSKDMFMCILGTEEGSIEYQKLAKLAIQFINEDTSGLRITEVQETFKREQEKCIKYLEDGTDSSEIKDIKYILDKLKGKIESKDFEKFRFAYGLQVDSITIGIKGYERISSRSLKNCHPESLPYLRKKILRSLPKSYINQSVKSKIEQLNNNEDSAEFEIDIYRHKAFQFIQSGKCDVEGTHTIFGQIFQWSKKYEKTTKFFRMNYTDARAFVINFKGENSRDGGGPYREAMSNICQELQSSSLSILAPIANSKSNHGDNRECWMINSGSESDPELFKFFGMFIGFAIRASQSFPLDLAPVFWKSLIKEVGEGLQTDQENEADLKAIDLYSYQMLDNLRKCASYMTDEEFEQEVSEEKFTTTLSSGLEVELCPGGFSRKLEKYNLPEYIRLVVNKRLGEYEELMRHVREGVNYVIPFEIYNMMSWKLLEERATGSKTIDIAKLKSITTYTDCKESGTLIQNFWKVLESFTDEQRSLYLKFVWGRTRLPSNTEERQEINAIQYRRGAMPLSHTCFFTLDLPRYPTYEEAREKILQSILYCGDIDGDNLDY